MRRVAVPRSATVAAAGDVLATSFDEELVLLNLNNGVYYGLEGVGSRIWALIQQPTSVADIRDTIAAEYEVDPEVCETDLRALLGELVNRGLAVVKS